MRKIIFALMILLSATAAQAAGTDWQAILKNVLSTQTGQGGAAQSSLSNTQIIAGLKEALNVSSKQVVAQLGKTGGFNLDPQIHIPLPNQLKKLDSGLKIIGYGHLTADLEERMNKAAELATPKAKQLFINSISKMTFADAREILTGGKQDAATQYLRKTMGVKLEGEMQPIIANTLKESGAIKSFDAATGKYGKLPMAANLKADLNNYVAAKAMDGIFYYIAKEEIAIRQNPAKRTSEILRKVFGSVR